MQTLEELYAKLENYKNFDEDDNDEKFLEIIDKIIEFKDPNSLPVLLQYFEDEERGWVLECLKGAIKSVRYLSKELYVKGIIENLYIMLPHAQEWATGFFYIILNEPACLNILKKNLHLAQKEQLLEILTKIYEESEVHRPIITELKRLLPKSEQ